ncbi:MAG: polysaccharide biosynthesis/export family protein [Silicimonas sp.]|nr:polysaccharide biosynthesis/export family protein [Silicimonas sp.]
MRSIAAFIVVVLSGTPFAASAEYLLRQGDVLSFGVVGLPEITGTTMIDMDGTAHFPLIGAVTAEGQPVDVLAASVRERFGKAAYGTIDADGRKRWITISPELVQFGVAEYRPVFLTGDVLRPGVVAFRPGMTALQAIASAGGVAALPTAPGAEVDVRRGVALEAKAAVERVRIAQNRQALERIEADLAALQGTFGAPVADNSTGETLATWLEARAGARVAGQDALQATAEQLENRLRILREQEKGALASVDFDNQAVERLEQLSTSGLVTDVRVTEARSALLLSTSRALEVGAEVAAVEVELTKLLLTDEVERIDEATRLLERIDDLRATLAVQEQEYRGTLAEASSVGGGPGLSVGDPSFIIIRDFPDGLRHMEAQLATRLMPGDVVQVELPDPVLAIVAN